MPGWTDRAKLKMLDWVMLANTKPTNFYIALLQSNTAPTNAINYISQVSEIVSGYGYTTGGVALGLGPAWFDATKQDISNARGYVQLANVAWTATGGQIPVNGTGARYAVMTGDTVINAAMREIYYYWDLTSPRTVSDGQTLSLIDMEIRINET